MNTDSHDNYFRLLAKIINNFELRKDWDAVWNDLKKNDVLNYKNISSFGNTDFLTAITLLTNYLDKGCSR